MCAGMRVDVAFYLQANTFRGNTTLQLQVVDIRSSLTPSRHEAEAMELVRRLQEGARLTAQERSRMSSTRELYGAYWVALERHLRQGKAEVETLPYLRSLASRIGGTESFLRATLAVEVFSERGLISVQRQGDAMTLCLNQLQGKVDLFGCPYLMRLKDWN